MTLPTPYRDESEGDFVDRCEHDPAVLRHFMDQGADKRRAALSQHWREASTLDTDGGSPENMVFPY